MNKYPQGNDLTAFLRRMISHTSESSDEKAVAQCIKDEMDKLGFDKTESDGLGNVIGWMGFSMETGKVRVRYDKTEFESEPKADSRLPEDIRKLINAVIDDYSYMPGI